MNILFSDSKKLMIQFFTIEALNPIEEITLFTKIRHGILPFIMSENKSKVIKYKYHFILFYY